LKSDEFALYLLAEDEPVRITDFIWLEEIVEKLEVKHGVIPEEVEESRKQAQDNANGEGALSRRRRLQGIGPDERRTLPYCILYPQTN